MRTVIGQSKAIRKLAKIPKWLQTLTRWLATHPQFVIVLVLLLGFGLRLYRLDAKDIWWDEASSAYQAPMSLGEITLYQARDQHPPLYYWALHFQYLLSGPSLFSLRFLSVVWGTLGVALAYALGRAMFHSRITGLVAAFLLAISLFHITWSQEIKMYVMVSTLSMLSVLIFWRLLRGTAILERGNMNQADIGRSPPLQLRFAYVLVNVLAIYCHYLALIVVAGQGVFLLVKTLPRIRHRLWQRLLWGWSIDQALSLALAVPWFLLHSEQSVSWGATPPEPMGVVVRMVATLLSVGTSVDVEHYTLSTLLLWLPLAALMLRRPRDERERWAVGLLWALILATSLLPYVMTLPALAFAYESKLAARFFILAQTPFDLMLARAIMVMRRRAKVLPLVMLFGVLALQFGPLANYYADRYPRDSYETLTRTIQALAREGDAILLFDDSEWPVFRYAYHGSLPIYQVPYQAPGGVQLVDPYVVPPWEAHEALWVVFSPQSATHDPQQAVRIWLEEQGQTLLDERSGQRGLTLYAKTPRDLMVTSDDDFWPSQGIYAPVATGLSFRGYDQALDHVQSGQVLSLITFWRVSENQEQYQVSASLVDAQGYSIGGQSELMPIGTAGGLGAAVRVRCDIPIAKSLPSAKYRLQVTVNGDQGVQYTLRMGSVSVQQTISDRGAEQAESQLSYQLGETIQLVGADLARDTYRPGEEIPLTLYWQALGPVDESYTVFVHVLGETVNPATGNQLWGQVDREPMRGRYPTTSWVQGDTITDRYEIPIDPQAPQGSYALEVGMYLAQTGERLPVSDRQGQHSGDHIILEYITIQTE